MNRKTRKTVCSKPIYLCKAKNNKQIEVDFNGGDISSDAGVLLLSKIDKRLGLLKNVASGLEDNRRAKSCKHDFLTMLKQRVYGIALGYEDLNDHDTLRNDLALQTAVDSESQLASHSTLSRLENKANRQWAWAIHQELFQQFVKSFKTPPQELILDFDATDDRVHGKQEGVFYHGYYEHECFLPLYVTCDKHLLVSYLRTSNIDGAKHTWAILALLVKNLRKIWPSVKILFRGDSGFCRHKMFGWCERNQVAYVCGVPSNPVITRLSEPWTSTAQQYFDHTHEKQRVFGEFQYQAKPWKKERRVIVKAEVLEKGPNPRYIVTNCKSSPQELYEDIYCGSGRDGK